MYECPTCHKHFSFPGPFDDHRVGNYALRMRSCLDSEQMIAAGWTTDTLVDGTVIWHAPANKDLNKIFGRKKKKDEPAA